MSLGHFFFSEIFRDFFSSFLFFGLFIGMEVDSIDNTEVYKEFIRYDEILRQINISNDLCPKEIHLQLEKIFSLRKRYINFVLRYQKIIELNSPISFMIDKLSASINEVEKIASNQLLNTGI